MRRYRCAFKGTTADDCRAWQKDFAAKLKTLLKPHEPPTTWKTIVVSVKDFADHRREELLLVADGHPPLPIYVLTPKEKSGKRAAILAIHGHGAHGHHPVAGRDDLPGVANAIKNNHYDYGRQLARARLRRHGAVLDAVRRSAWQERRQK